MEPFPLELLFADDAVVARRAGEQCLDPGEGGVMLGRFPVQGAKHRDHDSGAEQGETGEDLGGGDGVHESRTAAREGGRRVEEGRTGRRGLAGRGDGPSFQGMLYRLTDDLGWVVSWLVPGALALLLGGKRLIDGYWIKGWQLWFVLVLFSVAIGAWMSRAR